MALLQNAVRFGQRRLVGRLARSMPWVSTAVALFSIVGAVRQKGLIRGSADTALNAVPFVGPMKRAAEYVSGREMIPAQRTRHLSTRP